MATLSSNQTSVVLEISEIAETTPTVVSEVIGQETKPYYTDECDACTGGGVYQAKNWNCTFDDFNGWDNLQITGFQTIVAPGMNVGNINFEAGPYDKIVFTMEKSDGGNPEFNGVDYSFNTIPEDNDEGLYSNVSNMPEDDRWETEQGRLLYLYPKSSISDISEYNVPLSFEICEGDNGDLMVMSTDRQNDSQPTLGEWISQNAYPDVPASVIESTENVDFWQHFNGFISAHVHSAKWKYDGYNQIEWNDDSRHLHCSFIRNNGVDGPMFASMFSQGANADGTPSSGIIENTFGLRSSDELFDCNGGANGTDKGYWLDIYISAMVNAKVKVLTWAEEPYLDSDVTNYMLPDAGVDSSTYPWVWTEITEPGVHRICVPYINDTCANEEIWQAMELDMDYNYEVGWSTHTTYQDGGMSFSDKAYYRNQYRILRCEYDMSQPGQDGVDSQCYVRFSRIKLANGSVGIGEKTVDILQYNTIQSKLFSWKYLDIFDRDKVPLALNFNSGDLRDPSKKTTGYSKTFELPASNHNNRVLKTLIGNTANRDMSVGGFKADISWKKARITSNGVVVFNGFARIEKSIVKNGGRYTCHILQDPSYWPELIGDKKLCDLEFPDSSGEVTHVKDYNTIVNSWTQTQDDQDYVYPAISYGEWSGGPNGPRNFDDFHPAVYAKSIVDKIFSSLDTPYAIESNFFNTEFFKHLIIPYTSGEEYVGEGAAFGASGGYYGEAKSQNNNIPDLDEAGGDDCDPGYYRPVLTVTEGNAYMSPGSSGSIQGGYTVPFTGRYVVMYRAEIEISQCTSNYNSGRWSAWAHCNGQAIFAAAEQLGGGGSACNSIYWNASPGDGPPGFNVGPDDMGDGGNTGNWWWKWADGGDPVTKQILFAADFNVGDKIQIGFYGRNSSWGCTAYCNIDNQEFHVFPSTTNSFVAPQGGANIASALGCGVKQIDFLKGLTEMFNLYWTSDENAKKVMVEPYGDFYGSGDIVDWTNKIDINSIQDKYLIQELAKEVNFKYKVDSSDNLVEQYMNSMDRELWDYKHTNEDLYRKETHEMGTKVFSPTFRLYTAGAGCARTFTNSYNDNPPTIPAMWGGGTNTGIWGYFNNANRPDAEHNFNIRILSYWGLSPNTGTWKLLQNDGTPNSGFSSYPYAYTYNEEHGGDTDRGPLNGNAPYDYSDNLAWHNKGSGSSFQRGLFDMYWGRIYEKISGGASLRTCMIDLNVVDINRFDFRDLVRIKEEGGTNTYWTVNKIIDYQPGKNRLTKVELVQWDYEVPGTGGTQNELYYKKLPTNYANIDKNKRAHGDVQIKNKDGEVVRTMRVFKGGESYLVPTDEEEKQFKFSNQLTPRVLNPEPLIKGKQRPKQTNTMGKDSLAVGASLNAGQQQLVAGKYNQSKSGDLFQIGAGYKTSKGKVVKQNAISVDKEGNFNIYGGEVVAEFQTSDLTITGDVYYVDKSGNKRKVFLK